MTALLILLAASGAMTTFLLIAVAVGARRGQSSAPATADQRRPMGALSAIAAR